MFIVTTMEIPGYKVDSVIGEVMGLTARSANIGANLVAGFRSLGGGEITEYTQIVQESRNQVMARMWDQCVSLGGNAIIGMRFDSDSIASNFTEVCAYGTAVVVHPIATAEEGGTPQSIAHARSQAVQQPTMPAGPGMPQQGAQPQY